MKTIEAALNRLSSKNLIVKFYKYYIIDSILITKREGFKSLIKKRGWKVFAVVIAYYTIRDTILYILIPFLIAKGIL